MIALTVVTTIVTVVPGLAASPVRIVLGLLFVLFAPGYAVVAALFPEGKRVVTSETTENLPDVNIGGVERVTLSLGLSIGTVPLLALLLNLSPVSLELAPILAVLGGFTVLTSVVAVRRRLAIGPTRRFRVPYRRWLRSARRTLSIDSPGGLVVALVVLASVLIAGVGFGQTVTLPQNTETYTELYVLSGTDDGVGQATNYTTNLASGEEHSVVVGMGNQERMSVDYTVIVRLQQMRVQGNTTSPIGAEELDRFEVTVPHNRTVERSVSFTPTVTGERLRLQFLLYRGDVPSDPSVETAYREVHLWVSVS